jgi:hypothetical protein
MMDKEEAVATTQTQWDALRGEGGGCEGIQVGKK